MKDRRAFVKSIATGAGSAAALAVFGPARAAFGRQLESMRLSLRGSELQALRSDYMLGSDVTYLNHASIGTIPRAVFDARARYLEICETNPWLYMWGGAWEEPREEVRAKGARLLGCDSADVTFTHNTTESFNILAQGLPLGAGDEVVFSSLNHAGASQTWFHVAREKGFQVKRFQFPILDVPGMSEADILNAYDEHISASTRVLVFPHIDNIVGLRHPVRALARLARSRGVDFVAVDAAQTVGMIDVDMGDMGVDMYATSPHKWLQAPKGLGLMYVNADLRETLRPMWVTWGQNRWRGTARIFEDYGTRNLAEVLTLGDAIDFQERIDSPGREKRLRALWDSARDATTESSGTEWRSPASWELGGSLVAVGLRGKNATQLARSMFDQHGVVFRGFREQGLNSARLSPNVFNTEEEIGRFFELV